MKRISVTLVLMVLTILTCIADEYKIKAMNGQKIRIGSKDCRVGSNFKSNEKIYWNNSNVSIIEAQNLESMSICYFVPTGSQDKNSSQSSNVLKRFLNYFVNMTHLSTREVGKYNIEDVLTEQNFVLTDTIRIRTQEQDDHRSYYASFYLNGNKYTVPLDVDNGEIIFDQRKFVKDGVSLPYQTILTVYYIKEDYYYEITNGMPLTVFDIKNE